MCVSKVTFVSFLIRVCEVFKLLVELLLGVESAIRQCPWCVSPLFSRLVLFRAV